VNRKLKARIIEKFGTQYEFSHRIGEQEALVSKVIRGHVTIPKEKKEFWAKVLDAKPSIFCTDRQAETV